MSFKQIWNRLKEKYRRWFIGDKELRKKVELDSFDLLNAPRTSRFSDLSIGLRTEEELRKLDEAFPVRVIEDMHTFTEDDIQTIIQYLSEKCNAKPRLTKSIPDGLMIVLQLNGGSVIDITLASSRHPSNALIECGFVLCHIAKTTRKYHYFIGFATSYTHFVLTGKNCAPSARAIAYQIGKFIDDSCSTGLSPYAYTTNCIAAYDGKLHNIKCNMDALIEQRCMSEIGCEYEIKPTA